MSIRMEDLAKELDVPLSAVEREVDTLNLLGVEDSRVAAVVGRDGDTVLLTPWAAGIVRGRLSSKE